jgi:hypothetical protein
MAKPGRIRQAPADTCGCVCPNVVCKDAAFAAFWYGRVAAPVAGVGTEG